MRGIFEKYGLVEKRVPIIEAAQQTTIPGNQMIFGPPLGMRGNQGGSPRRMTRTWKSLLTFSESPIPSRAITLVADRIQGLDFQVGPKSKFANDGTDYSDAIEIVQRILDSPNCEDEDFPTFVRQIVEDQMVFDFGCWEYIEAPNPAPVGNDLLALSPVPGWSIERLSNWRGEPDRPRWIQRSIGNNNMVPLLDKQIEALILRKRTSRSYGISPCEVAIGLMEAWLGLASYQAQVASEAYPKFMLSLGETTDQPLVDRMRAYWNLELVGQGRPGIFGGFAKPEVLNLAPVGDDGLYLRYEEKLVRALAFTFRLKPLDFGIERDVNRSTAETSAHQSTEEAVKPYTRMITSRVNQRLIPRIAAVANNPLIMDLEFTYDTIDPWDEQKEADILTKYVERDLVTINEGRQELGYDPIEDGDQTLTPYRKFFDGGASGSIAVDESEEEEPNEPPVEPENSPTTKKAAASLILQAAKKKGQHRLKRFGKRDRKR